MTRKREFLDYLADIQEASQHIVQFMAGMTWAQFAQDQKTIYGELSGAVENRAGRHPFRAGPHRKSVEGRIEPDQPSPLRGQSKSCECSAELGPLDATRSARPRSARPRSD